MKQGFGTLLLSSAAFAGGVVAGFLLTPRSGKENLQVLNEYSKETKSWLQDQGQKIISDSEKRIDKVSQGIRKTVKDAVPDLYEATEDLHFTEEEGIEEINKRG
ncbi:MAG TPA: YtxH domain-containing protein [Balneolaceae bacterium]|nr:YtxH domain-containing protein [Balneolaceae bacterium]